MAAGVVALAAFAAWERVVCRRPGGQPLVDLTLFRSAGFTWGTILSTMVSFALFGITFVMPQYFLDVRGLDSLASGLRLLPFLGGLAVGLGIGQRLQSSRPAVAGRPSRGPLVGAKILVGAGFAIMAVALVAGTATSALGRPSAAAAHAARASVAGGLAVARATGSGALLGSVRDAYTSGLDVMLRACAGIALAAALLALAFLPHQEQAPDTGPQDTGPMGTGPMGTGPMGTGPMGTAPMGTAPRGTAPRGTAAQGAAPGEAGIRKAAGAE